MVISIQFEKPLKILQNKNKSYQIMGSLWDLKQSLEEEKVGMDLDMWMVLVRFITE